MSNFDHILNWTLKRGSHPFPGPDGGTCINEAAVVAHGLPYRPIKSHLAMPPCFSRPICRLALYLNDEANDMQRQRLLPFVTRLACADTPAVEAQRAAYIRSHIDLDGPLPLHSSFDKGIRVLEGVLAIGRQADPLGIGQAAERLAAARETTSNRKSESARSLRAKLKGWMSKPEGLEAPT
ncbi:hypothetical protein [Methylobacterium longum]|uniref:Uncharacterized protein n=1 Tax=Methylobacterium longum TaxID=767694 RepID=A0ABT8AJT5_9HYPH|nr:hypothetical protein [Methylobacterium longum]MDN3570143.1 hypothetical protein [Methylobacterium longum]GJE12219.1 hypothetical protein FOHLNKBM_3266 [Methylobacterium longum]